jgi:tRNA A37 threonylcarbamoyladenosine biosynthesis protein TsaE
MSGEHGAGKTTMVKKASQQIGGCVIYVNVPKDIKEFDQAFASATGYNFRSYSGLFDIIHGMIYKNGSELRKGTYLYSYHDILT